jgi:mRNA interferase RelE/StbE
VAKFDLVFKRPVSKDLNEIPKQDVQRILERIDALRDEPRPQGSVKPSGKAYDRVRQGNYRIVYELQDSQLVVIVIKVGHRRAGCSSAARGKRHPEIQSICFGHHPKNGNHGNSVKNCTLPPPFCPRPSPSH